MIAFVPQETDTFCFPACLESFFAENEYLISQREIIARASDIFCDGDQLGGLAPAKISLIGKVFDLEVIHVEEIAVRLPKGESVFVHLRPEVGGGHFHWVRLLGMHLNHTFLMDPAHEHCPRKIETNAFFPLVNLAFHVKLKPMKSE